MTVLFSKKLGAVVLEDELHPDPNKYDGVLYAFHRGTWVISKRGSLYKHWMEINERHVPKQYKAMALILGG